MCLATHRSSAEARQLSRLLAGLPAGASTHALLKRNIQQQEQQSQEQEPQSREHVVQDAAAAQDEAGTQPPSHGVAGLPYPGVQQQRKLLAGGIASSDAAADAATTKASLPGSATEDWQPPVPRGSRTEARPRPPPKYDPCIDGEVEAYFNRPEVQAALHANVSGALPWRWTDCSPLVQYSRRVLHWDDVYCSGYKTQPNPNVASPHAMKHSSSVGNIKS